MPFNLFIIQIFFASKRPEMRFGCQQFGAIDYTVVNTGGYIARKRLPFDEDSGNARNHCPCGIASANDQRN